MVVEQIKVLSIESARKMNTSEWMDLLQKANALSSEDKLQVKKILNDLNINIAEYVVNKGAWMNFGMWSGIFFTISLAAIIIHSVNVAKSEGSWADDYLNSITGTITFLIGVATAIVATLDYKSNTKITQSTIDAINKIIQMLN
jgi:hypothetical protein